MSATAEVAARTIWDADAIAASVKRHVRSLMGKRWNDATPRDLFVALAFASREMLIERWFETQDRVRQANAKRLYYLSVEFLIGRSLAVVAPEPRRARRGRARLPPSRRRLGGGRRIGAGRGARQRRPRPPRRLLPRFARDAQDMPGFGYGINYDYGLFRQAIEHGQQREYPEGWQRPGAAWLIERPELACLVPGVWTDRAPAEGRRAPPTGATSA